MISNQLTKDSKTQNRILHLTIKKQWFDLISSGEKTEEYRTIKPHWEARLNCAFDNPYHAIHFRNGYSKNAPQMLVEFQGIRHGRGNPAWGAPPGIEVFILVLGEILAVMNDHD